MKFSKAHYNYTPTSQTKKSWLRFICHQKPDRCFFINNKPMLICSRCFGVYLGLVVGVIIPIIIPIIYSLSVKIMYILMIVCVLPLALDGLTQFLGLRKSNNNLRFISGLITGIYLGILFNWLIFNSMA